MNHGEITSGSLFKWARMIQKGEVSPVDLVETVLSRIEQADGIFKSYITVVDEDARQSARIASEEIHKKEISSVLHGIPYACKDMFMTKGIPTTGGSKILAGWKPDNDAEAVKKLNNAGGILLGKLNQHEFAYGATGENHHYGTPPNPWDTTRLAGGSSSGSAAAVAAGLAFYALGTDTGGSTRVPAALCGVVGLKPTYDLINTKGVIPYCWTLDHIGIITNKVIDAAAVLNCLISDNSGIHRPQTHLPNLFSDSREKNLNELRIGIPKTYFFEKTDPEILASIQKIIQNCQYHKAELIDVDLPDLSHTRTVSLLVQLPEALSYHSRYLKDKKELYGEDILGGLALGQHILAENYIRAKRMIGDYRLKINQLFEKVDIIITPTCPVTAPVIGEQFVTVEDEEEPVGNAITRFTHFFNLTGNPAITIPCGIHSSGLPMGVQLIGRHFEEDRLLKTAHFLESMINVFPGATGLELPVITN